MYKMGLRHHHHSNNNGLSWCWTLIMWTTVLATIVFNNFFSVGCPLEEYEALLEFKASCNGTSPPSWGKRRDCCLWERVICNNSTKRVSELLLSEFQLYQQGTNGTQASEIQSWQLNLSIFSSFRELRHLDLSGNGFTGSLLSTTLLGLKKLKVLDLGDNDLTGEIPMSLGYLTSLEVLKLGSNELAGSLSLKVFQGLKNLQELQLQHNQINGSLPSTLGNLTSLQYVDLSYNLLEGTISEQFFAGLPSLQYLDLSYNYLHGKLSFRSFANMTKLEGIILSNNTRLEVHINSWSSIQQLQLRILMLSSCKLDKNAILSPDFLCSQRHLEVLDLSYNNLIGNIPTCLLNNNTNMEYLNLRSNLLTGPIYLPSHHINSMNTIDISVNHLDDLIPSNISMVFPNLVALNFSSNHLLGNIPSSLVNMSHLCVLDLSDNHIAGEVPAQLMSNSFPAAILKLSNNNLHGKIHNLNFINPGASIYLDGNMLSGTLPSNNLSNISLLDVHDNNLDGSIPETTLDASFLESLILRGNHFHGRIPQCLCNLTTLYVLDLSNNSFSGSLPLCFPSNIRHVSFAGNALIGNIPSVLFNLSTLIALDISKNRLSGLIPRQIGSELNMEILILRENFFQGLVPVQLCNLQNLRILDLSHNNLSGTIPSCLGTMAFEITKSFSSFPLSNLWTLDKSFFGWTAAEPLNSSINLIYDTDTELQEEEFSTKGELYEFQKDGLVTMTLIDLSANKLTGKIPPEIGNLSGLISLNLSYNQLTGPIPEALSNLDQIESLDLSNNRLSGDIPWQLGQLKFLEVFSVAQNNLSGCIPSSQGQLATFGKSTYEGNVGLHGPPLDETCTSTSNTTASVEEEDKEVSSIDIVILYAVSAAAYIVGFWVSIAILFCNCWGRSVRVRLDSYVDFLFGEVSMVVRKLISTNRGGNRNRKNHV